MSALQEARRQVAQLRAELIESARTNVHHAREELEKTLPEPNGRGQMIAEILRQLRAVDGMIERLLLEHEGFGGTEDEGGG